MATGTLVKQGPDQSASADQVRAWQFYGLPFIPGSSTSKKSTHTDVIGEVRYAVGWIADQMSRMDWQILVNGDEEWTLTLPDKKGTVSSKEDLTEASATVLDVIGWNENSVRQITTNLFVAGQGDYIAYKDDKGATRWKVVSVVARNRGEELKKALLTVPMLWPHPADDSYPDAPLFGVLPVLEDLTWLAKLSSSQSANRIGMRGILAAATGLDSAGPKGNFWEDLKDSIKKKMEDPTDSAPLFLRGDQTLVEPSGSGLKGLGWLIPDFPYDDKIAAKIEKAIQRLAYGLPLPPEILTGMQAQSRATAFQVEESSYRAHIEPPATLVAHVAEQALALVFPEGTMIEVRPDPSELLARRHSVQDVKDALLTGAVSFKYFREVLGIPETEAATAADILLLLQILGRQAEAAPETDPANVAADEPVNAAVGEPEDDPLSDPELQAMSNMLQALDEALLMELGGATQQAVDRARERVGAKARTNPDLRRNVDKEVPNSEVAAAIGVQALTDAGIPVSDIIDKSLEPLTKWWSGRITEARDELAKILGDDVIEELDDSFLEGSVALLTETVARHAFDTLESPVAQPLPAGARREVMATAGGGID
jgi:hypothetical protein